MNMGKLMPTDHCEKVTHLFVVGYKTHTYLSCGYIKNLLDTQWLIKIICYMAYNYKMCIRAKILC
jgi:hypothetical protein